MNKLLTSVLGITLIYSNAPVLEAHSSSSKLKHIHQGKNIYWSNGATYKALMSKQTKFPIKIEKPSVQTFKELKEQIDKAPIVAQKKEAQIQAIKEEIKQIPAVEPKKNIETNVLNVQPTPVTTSTPSNEKALPKLPSNAYKYLPDLVFAINDTWPTIPMKSFLPGLIEQESCISLTHKKCWNPTVELKTSREYGFGLGQFTIAYNANRTVRFNTWEELRDKDVALKDWDWANRFSPILQIKALLIKNRINFSKLAFNIKDTENRMAFLAATYNGGSVMKDRSICMSRNDCDPSAWLVDKKVKPYSVESFSFKSKLVHPGYGKSFFAISREYPRNILFIRRPKYIPHVGN